MTDVLSSSNPGPAVTHTTESRRQEANSRWSAARRAVLFFAVMCAGIMAGLFLVYSHTIMRGLGATDDRTFVTAFQEIDRSVENPFVAGTLIAGVVLTAATIVLDRRRPTLWWVATALVLLVATVVITAVVNVPLNNQIKAAGDPGAIDVARVRAEFREVWWNAWNAVRCATSTTAFACLAWSLVRYERADISAT